MKKNIRIFYILFGIIFINAVTYAQNNPAVLSLDEAISIALANNFDIQIAKNNQTIAEIENNKGNAGLLPTARATTGYTIGNTNIEQRLNTGTTIKRNGNISQNENIALTGQYFLFNGFRGVAAKRRLELQEERSMADVKNNINNTVYNVINAYINIKRFQQQYKATVEAMTLFEERIKLAENKLRVGTGNKSDLLQAQIDFNEQKNSLLSLESNIAQSKTTINNLLARNPATLFTVQDTINTVELPKIQEVIAGLDSLNPALVIAKYDKYILEQQNREINALRLPSVLLNAGTNLSNTSNTAGQMLRNFSYGPNAGVTLVIPIFQGGIIKQQLKVNSIQQKNQDIFYKQTLVNLETTITNAYINYDYALKQFDLEKENLKLVEENNIIAMERFKKASINTVELRQTQLNLVAAQTRMINAQFLMEQALNDVLLISGSLVR
ncbi:TolC family protein [Polluticaenibacter yanchengensis]|uniref:TolC family protein n=1 Tax=Polluticaenibacter yanchengensis TaxID=3014562 RepID=A0ABT4UMD6_9BACT|nr:TolC family protein [Chitinophagaceae bacterium LY-5]